MSATVPQTVTRHQTLARLLRKRRARVSIHASQRAGAACRACAEQYRRVCDVSGKKKKVQTDPPSIPVAELFPEGDFPEGEWQSYKDEYALCAAQYIPIMF